MALCLKEKAYEITQNNTPKPGLCRKSPPKCSISLKRFKVHGSRFTVVRIKQFYWPSTVNLLTWNQHPCFIWLRTVTKKESLPKTGPAGSTRLRAPNKMNLHSNSLFYFWTASGCIDHPRMACFAFLARSKNAHSRCDAHCVSDSRSDFIDQYFNFKEMRLIS